MNEPVSRTSTSRTQHGDASLGDEISVVIPAFNEAERLPRSLETLARYLEDRFRRFEIIVVDDGSSDGTVEAVRRLGDPRVTCLENELNFGKGYSVRRGMLAARFDPALFSDADLSTPAEETATLLESLRGGADVAIGSRRAAGVEQVERSPLRRFVGWAFSKVVQWTTLGGFRDTQCGFKMFRRAAIGRIFPYQTIDRWGFDVEILFIARRRGLEIREVPVRWFQSKGTRLHWLTPLSMLWELARIRWSALRGRYRERAPQ